MRSVKITRLPVGAQFALLVGLALGMVGFAAPALAQPGAPTNIMITPGDKSLAVSWTAPTNVGAGILGYDVRRKLASGTAYLTASSSAAQYTITNLADAATYDVQVRALDSNGQESAWSTAVQATTLSAADLPPANVVPSAPTVRAGADAGVLLVSWPATPTNPLAPVTDYDIRYKLSTVTSWTELPFTGTGTSAEITGLQDNFLYDVQVRATNPFAGNTEFPTAVSGPGAWSVSGRGTTIEPGVPFPPAAPMVTASQSAGVLEVSWDAAALGNGNLPITGYELQWKLTSAAISAFSSANVSISGTTATISGLADSTAYDVQVRALNRVGSSPWSASGSATTLTPTAPDAPVAPSLTPGDEQLTVTWQAPANDGGSAITDYDVRWRRDGTTDWTEVDDTTASTALTATITGLLNGFEHEVQVRAQNAQGTSAWSASATATPATVPDPITDLSANTIAPGPGEVFVDFTLPGRNGADFVRYDVEYRPGTSGSWTRVERLNLSITSIGIPNLVNGQSYQVRVRAVNSVGNAAWSNIIMATPAGPPDAPSAPTLTVGNRQLTVAWQAPASDGGRAIRNYRLRWKRAEASDYSRNNLITIADATVRSRVIPNLVNAQAYDVQVSATNPFPGGWSAATQATPVGPPDAPLAPTLSPSDAQIVVAWQAPANNGGQAIDNYLVEWKLTSETSWGNQRGVSGLTTTLASLTNQDVYDVRVAARSSLGRGDWSPVATATVGAPVKVTPAAPMVAAGTDAGVLVVRWTAPPTHPLAPVTDYDIHYKLPSATSWTELAFSGTGTSAEITGLQDSTQYEVQVRASNPFAGNAEFPTPVSGAGDWSPSGSATTLTPTAPSAPAAPTVDMSQRAGMLSVSWAAPAPGTGNLPITGYQLQWRTGSNAFSAPQNVRGLSASIAMLADTTAYDVQVRAVNRVGQSAWSGSGMATTLTPTAPSTPRAPTLSSGSSGVLSVSWSAPADGGTAITAWEVQYKLSSAPATAFGSANVQVSGASATITELEEGEEYDVRVRAQNRIGMSAWSAIATGSPSSAQRNARTTSRALSQAGGAVAAGAIDVLGGQLGAATGGAASGGAGGAAGGNQSNFTIAGLNITPGYNARTALPVLTHADEAAPKHNFALSDLLQLGAFRLSLFHKKDGDKAKKRRSRPATSAPSKWAIWGRGNVRGFASETDAGLELDGNAYAGWLGVDYTHSRSLMGGLAVSYDESRTDYTDPEFGGGEVSTRLGSFYPYLRISPTEALDLWGLMGFGWGDLSFSGEGQEDTSTDMSLQVYALGAQLKLIDLYGAQFSLKSDASFAILETASQANLPGIRTEPSRMRFALAAQYPWQIDSVSRVTPSLELGGRLDFNEVSGGAGMELGGAVNYNHSTLRLNAEARARGLVYHNDPNVQDWGVSFQLRVDPNQFGQGFFASFAPHWGQSQSRVQRLWRDLDAPQGLAQDMSLQPHQMEAEFGYGFALPRMKATLSPFGRTRFAQTGAQTFSLGSRLQLGDMKLELTGERQTAPLAPTDHRMSLHLSMPLGQ